MYYVLDNKKVVVATREKFIEMFEKKDSRIVAKDEVGKYHVSTVFLGLDHNYSRIGEPIVFETMIFGEGPCDGYQSRYSTYEQAEQGHKEALKIAEKNEEG